jgi:hypothetical protein
MNESVESEALVIPNSSGSPTSLAAFLRNATVLILIAEPVDLFLHQELGIADVLDLDPAEHLANDHLDVLIVDIHTLQAINLLNFIHEVVLQGFHTQYTQNVVRLSGPSINGFAGTYAIFSCTLMCVPRGMSYSRSLPSSPVMMSFRLPFEIGPNLTTPLISDIIAVSPGRVLQKLDDTRQTADDVLGLGGLTRDLGDNVAGLDLLAVLDDQVAPIGI